MEKQLKQKGQRSVKATEISPRLVIRVPSAEGEFEYLWFILSKLPLYREMGFTVAIPDENEFQRLTNSNEDFQSVDKKSLRKLFIDKVYSRNYYKPGLDTLKKCQQTIEAAVPLFKELYSQWGFKVFSEYHIYLTAYGPGGEL